MGERGEGWGEGKGCPVIELLFRTQGLRRGVGLRGGVRPRLQALGWEWGWKRESESLIK